VVGVSIIAAYLTQVPLWIYLVVLNIPFIALSAKKIGLRFVLLTVYAIMSLSLWVTVFHPIPELTKDIFLSAIFGGGFLGIGVGLIIRNGGCLDGTEILSIIISKKFPFSVGEIVMFFNVFIFFAAAFVFGIDRALYSIVAYFIAFKLIDMVITGFNQSHSFFIVTQKPAEVSQALMKSLGSGVTILKGMGGFSKVETDVLYMIIGRLEIQKAKELILEIDEAAFITIQNVHEQISKSHRKGHLG
jgi:uncharacterized membrane-anchored protein YitT (DUF2179 family)